MRVCASLSHASDMDSAMDADMVEVRLDLLGTVPDTRGKDTLVTFRDPVDLDVLPDGFDGMIDVGEQPRPDTGLTVVGSYHDYDSTPGADAIVSRLDAMDADIRKGAFRVNRLADLASILDASKRVDGRHVLLGMGQLGAVTRIRADILGNEFSFGYIGEPTAPGQFSVGEMLGLGDGCTVLGILGNPLGKSKSPAMHNAALRDLGIRGVYLPFETPDLDRAEDVIRGYGIRGVNVTIPYKQEIIQHLDRVDSVAERIGAVNTVVNDGGVLTGYNTDVIGIATALDEAGIDVTDGRAVVMGSGGAARACLEYLTGRNCDVTVAARNEETGRRLASEFGQKFRNPNSVSVRMHDLLVNCTPVGMYSDGPYPINIEGIDRGLAVFDMVYGTETPLVALAKSRGCRVAYGADMLAGQGAASFELWTGERDAFGIMRRELA